VQKYCFLPEYASKFAYFIFFSYLCAFLVHLMTSDELYMTRCLELARLGEMYVAPNPMVGAVLVHCDHAGHETIVGEGWHEYYGGPHAEVNCMRDAERRMALTGVAVPMKECTMYVNMEPCSHWGKTPPCANMLVERGVGRVVVGQMDPNSKVSGRGVNLLRDAGIEVTIGVMESECRALNKRFLCLHERHRPYVLLKWAQTRDGYLDRRRETAGEGPVVISTPLTKQLVHRMRAQNMAIMVGTHAALLDNPGLKVTRWYGRHPLRVVPDRHGVLDKNSKLFSADAETIVYSERTDWPYILSDLAERGVHSIMVEGGTELLNHILSSDLWDEAHVEVSTRVLGIRPEVGVKAPTIDLSCARVTEMDGEKLYYIERL